jgi:hypothetical protein
MRGQSIMSKLPFDKFAPGGYCDAGHRGVMAKPPSKKSADDRVQAPGLLLREYVLRQFDAAIRALGAPRSQLHAGVHQARKALRRSVAVLDLARRAMPESADSLRLEIKEACRRLSSLRDADALIETLDCQIKAQAVKLPALVLLRTRLLSSRAKVLQRALTQDPNFHGCRETLRGLGEKLAALPWEAVAARDIHRALARSQRRVRYAKQVAKQRQTESARHRWRRRLRHLVDQLEAGRWASNRCSGLPRMALPRKKLLERAARLGHERDLRQLRRQAKRLGCALQSH